MSELVSDEVAAFLAEVPIGTVATLRPDGRVRQTIVYYVREGDRLLISTESKRAKSRDVERTAWASLCVQGPAKPYPSVTLEGPARILREHIGEATARIFEVFTGAPGEEHSDEELAAVDRVILEITIARVYGAVLLAREEGA